MSWSGHYWTLASTLRRPEPAWAPWAVEVPDERHGSVRLTGRLTLSAEARSILVCVHGLGGHPGTAYMRRAARAADRAGISCLRLALRGADRRGEDFYHAGLVEDLAAALNSPEVARHERVHLLGFSLGGHVALRLATEAGVPLPRSVAAICPPLDLAAGARAFDEEVAWAYRRHVLGSLKRIYSAVAARRSVPTPWPELRRVRSIREYDRLTVVPRHGFDSVDHYYRSQSVGPRLGGLRVPALVVVARHDPLVPHQVVEPSLAEPPPALEVRRSARGGHVGFPPGFSLDEPAPRGVEPQVLSWLSRR